METIIGALLTFVSTLFRLRLILQLEIVALRHQLAVYQRTSQRPRINPGDRIFWSWLSRRWSGWRGALVFVQTRTVIRNTSHSLSFLVLVGLLASPVSDAYAVGSDELEGTAGHAVDIDALQETAQPTGVPSEMVAIETELSTEESAIRCDGDGPCIEVGTQLPFRVLPRPMSHVFKGQKDDLEEIFQANVRAFHPLYVYGREAVDLSNPAEPKGWYKVGVSSTGPQGWMRAADVIEWRQALLVSYTHPGNPLEGRNPVLMFRDLETLKQVVEAPDRESRASTIYQRVQKKDFPDELVSMEPKRFVDITRQFYVLPIVRFDNVTIDGDEARYLQVAAAVPGARGPDTLKNEAYVSQAETGRGSAETEQKQDLKVNIVFVLDTTRSTQPYIDSTRAAIASMVKRMNNPELQGRIRFGLVGYRDAQEKVPKIEYTAYSFTPSMVDAETLVSLLEKEVKATSIGTALTHIIIQAG